MASSNDRKAELALKKEKLRSLREEKIRKEESRRHGLSGPVSSPGSSADLRVEADALLKNLGMGPLEKLETRTQPPDSKLCGRRAVSATGRPKKLHYCLVAEFDIKPQGCDSYTKETQTIDIKPNPEPPMMDYYVLTYDESPVDHDSHLMSPFPEAEHPDAKMLKSVHGEMPRQTANAKEDLKKPALVELTDAQIQQMLLSEGFRHFFDKSSRLVERALYDTDEELPDNSYGDNTDQLTDDHLPPVRDFFDPRWSLNRTVIDLDWSAAYPELLLTAYSPVIDDSSGAASSTAGVTEEAGCVLIWNLKYPQKSSPEFRFHCNEPITAAAMVRFHPNLVIGGTYSGQLVLWDSRSNKRTPVQRSTFTTMAHTQPVNSVQVIGSQNAHNAISLSSDGTMCSWALDMLGGPPRERIRVCESSAPSSGMMDLYPSCMAFFAGDQNNFVVGSESGNIFTDQRHSRAQSLTSGLRVPIQVFSRPPSQPGGGQQRFASGQVGSDQARIRGTSKGSFDAETKGRNHDQPEGQSSRTGASENHGAGSSASNAATASSCRPIPFRGHKTMVTGIATHPSPLTTVATSAISFSNLFLSSSLDWTVRLWSARDHIPLHTFDDYSECVYGVDWSPVHPALFAAVDGTGRIDIWNLNQDLEVPAARYRSVNSTAMNKVKWDPSGLFIAAGDDEGHVRVCGVPEQLAIPTAEASTRLAHVFADLKATAASQLLAPTLSANHQHSHPNGNILMA